MPTNAHYSNPSRDREGAVASEYETGLCEMRLCLVWPKAPPCAWWGGRPRPRATPWSRSWLIVSFVGGTRKVPGKKGGRQSVGEVADTSVADAPREQAVSRFVPSGRPLNLAAKIGMSQ